MTILFAKDWLKHRNAAIHYTTKNKSFIKLAEIYHQMGVSNNAFHLSILDRGLMDIDPFDEDLSIEWKARIVSECKNNFWYYLREILRIPVPGSLVPIPFEANRANIALYWLFFNHVMTLIVILRQTGKTTTLMSLVTYLLNFGTTNTFINLLTKSEGLKAETLGKVKALFEELPDYLNFSTKKDIFNSDEIKLIKLDNKFKGNLSSSSPKQAEKVGRGFTSPINLIDEGAFIDNIAIAMGAMLMSGNAARTAAALNNKPYGTIIATTAGNTDDRDGQYVYKLATAATIFDEKFFDAVDNKHLLELIYTNSNASKNETKRPIVNITMSYRQLGYDDEWLKTKLAENISTPENIKRDIFNQWLSGSNQSPIPKHLLELIREHVKEPIWTTFYAPYNFLLRFYVTKEELDRRKLSGVSFIVGVDTSDGAGRDDISFVVRDHTNGEQLCVAVFNEINLITLADFFVAFMIEYDNSTMVIERKNSAPTILDYMVQKFLQNGINPFTRIYNTIVQNKEEHEDAFKEIMKARSHNLEIFTKYKKHLGFVTSGSGITSRSELYSGTMMSMLKYTGATLYDEQLVGQIAALVIRNNRIDHPSGGSDDLVIGSLLSYWLLIVGKNLNYYGIDTTSIMKSNRVYLNERYEKSGDEFDEAELVAQEAAFNELLERFKVERNEIIARQMELMIRKAASELSEGGVTLSVEEMLEDIRRDKKVTRLH